MKIMFRLLFVIIISSQLAFASTGNAIAETRLLEGITNSTLNIKKVIEEKYAFEPKLQQELRDFWKDKTILKFPSITVDGRIFTIKRMKKDVTVEIQNTTDKGFYYRLNEQYYFYDFNKTFSENFNFIKEDFKTSFIELMIPTANAQVIEALGILIGVGVVMTVVVRSMYLNSRDNFNATLKLQQIEEEIARLKKSCEENVQLRDVSNSIDKIKDLVEYYNKTTTDFEVMCRNVKKTYPHISEQSMMAFTRICFDYRDAKMCLRDKINNNMINNSKILKDKIYYEKKEDRFNISK